ncbi:MAG: ABC transporter substrate-binding protein, partial [Eubacteriales bacterium]|nr:ABC transporter substrate-binding protein [Eubacteriales bacterium]
MILKTLAVCLGACLLFTGCSSSGNEQAATQEETDVSSTAVTFTDALGREVTVDNPQRVVTLIGSFTDVWLLAGGEVVGACDDSWASLNLDLPEGVINTGKVAEPNLENILSAEPDFVIASVNTSSNVELLDTFDELGITCAYFDVSTFEDYLSMLKICTDITGRSDLYEKNGLDVQKQIEEAEARADGSAPTVLYLRTSTKSIQAKTSEGNVCGEILANLGCVNVADSDETLLESLSLEAIMRADPDYIFVTPQGTDKEAALANIEETFTSNPAWQSLTAVKEGRYYVLDPYLYNLKPNERWGESYEKMADILLSLIHI